MLLRVLGLAIGICLRQDASCCRVKYALNILGRSIICSIVETAGKPYSGMMAIAMISSR
jgi:hypothetical protein